jgi:ribonuclease P protein component
MIRPIKPKVATKSDSPSRSYKFGPLKRVKKRSSFVSIQGKGRKFKTASLLVCFLPQLKDEPSISANRIGITVTTKVHKRANRRNRIKRIFREIFRLRCHEFVRKGDIVVILLKGGVDRTYLELYEEFDFALKKLGLL